jgi:hypothetical protein
MVFLIDRLFIQYDWDYQAAEQRSELARAAWEKSSLEKKLAVKISESTWRVFVRRTKRFVVIWSRVLLSAAIGLTIASFLELVIYKDEIRSTIHRLHYEENKEVYDEINTRTAFLDGEITKARSERNRFLELKAGAEAELNNLELSPPPLPSDKHVAVLDEQISTLRKKIEEEEAKVRRYDQDMIAEFRGTQINPWNSLLPGIGPRYQTARDLKVLSLNTITSYRNQIDELEGEKKKATSSRQTEYDAVKKTVDQHTADLRAHINDLASSLSQAQTRFAELERARDPAIQTFVAALKNKPGFLPISFGVASQFRALRTIYARYASTFEMYMIKLLIMLLEMTPVLQKVLLSPATLYAVRLDTIKRSGAYAHFDEQVKLRQEHLRRKADAALDEELDGIGIKRVREPTLHEGKVGA